MTTPTPGPNVFNNSTLIGRIDALTRAVGQLQGVMSRSAASAAGGGMNFSAFGPMGRQGNFDQARAGLGQRMQSNENAFTEARRRAREDLTASRARWDRQRTQYDQVINDPSRSQDVRDRAMAMREGAEARYYTGRRRTAQNLNSYRENRAQMQSQLQDLNTAQRQQTTMNAMAAGAATVGAVAGAMRSYSGEFEEATGQYGREAALMGPMGGGTIGQRAERAMRRNFQYGLQNVATSHADLAGGALAIRQQSYAQNEASMLRNAAGMAFLNPGLGVQGAAQIQGEFGSARSFYAAQQFGLTPTRTAGGGQTSPAAVWSSLAQRTFGGRTLGQVSQSELEDSLAQNGSLSISMQQFGQAAGLSGMALEGGARGLRAERALRAKNPQMTAEEAQNVLADAATDTKAGQRARRQLKDAGMEELGGSYQDVQNLLAGKSREGHLSQSAGYLDAARTSANTLVNIYNLLNKVLSPFADVIGGARGLVAGGGKLGAAGTLLKGIGGGSISGGAGRLLTTSGSPGLGGAVSMGGPLISGLLGGDEGTPKSKQGEPDHAGVSGIDKYKKSMPSGSAQAAIDFARSQIGKRYILGANGPDAWDCSSLTQAALKAAGVSIDRTTYTQIDDGQDVPMDQLQPGDLVFYSDLSHVGLYAGGGSVVEAANPRAGVVEKPIGWSGKYTRAIRVMNGGVVATKTLGGKSNDPTKSWGGGGVGGFGSVNEIDALGILLSGGGGGGSAQQRGSTPSAQQNTEAGGGTGKDSVSDTRANVELGRKLAATYGWTGSEFDALYKLWMGESNWNHHADNPTSDAYGIPQAMSNLHAETRTEEWKNSPEKQIIWGLNYIKNRPDYGSPSKAYAKWLSRNPHWYEAGAWDIPEGGQDARLHGGEMVLDRNSAHSVRQALLNKGLPPVTEAAALAGGQGVSLEFSAGSIVINMPAASADGARSAAEQFVSAVASDRRIKTLMGGW
ncbi:C40 family peptidase [Streptomyces sp. IMTB 1903]|uniref:C40 family peptidase n=1 Tax=Streptomyces sp. IMTB 1903 TaxID=1776680 RepID=UPI0007574BA6|nr:C40 family peptidase [Streptomyces sp. IMTB 1903]